MQQIWKQYIDDEHGAINYDVSNTGKIRNHTTKRERKFNKTWRSINLPVMEAVLKSFTIPKMVAKMFVENPDPTNLRYIKYKNGDNNDYRASNIEWTTKQEIVKESWMKRDSEVLDGHGMDKQIILQYGDEVFPSIRRAVNKYGFLSGPTTHRYSEYKGKKLIYKEKK